MKPVSRPRAKARAVFVMLVGSTLSVSAPAQAAAQAPASPPAHARPAAPAQAAASLTEPAEASYVSQRINGKPLPMTDRASDDKGVQYLIEFDELILAIRPNHEFRAALRFRQTLARKGAKTGQDPIQKMVVFGTWSVVGTELRFVPDPRRGGEGLRILTGTFAGREIDVPFDYRNGTVTRRAAVVLLRDDRIF